MMDPLTAPPRILVMDNEPMSRTLLDAILRKGGTYDVHTSAAGRDGVEAARLLCPDLMLVDTTGASLPELAADCLRLKTGARTRRMAILLLAPLQTSGSDLMAEVGADDILFKPYNRADLLGRVRVLLRIKTLSDQLGEMDSVMRAFSRIIEARQGGGYDAHTERVVLYATALGRAAGLGTDALRIVTQAAMLRDLGEVGVPDRLFQKRGALSRSEAQTMQRHAALGEEIISPFRATEALLPIVRHHHERIDGSGYPDGLAGEEIPLGARIVAIADAYDAMLSSRSYRPSMTSKKALATLKAGAGRQWDSHLVTLFEKWILSMPHTSLSLK